MKYIERLENEKQTRVGKIRRNGGGEVNSKSFVHYCDSKGIQIQLTTPRSSSRNGIAGRMHRTLQNKAHVMLNDTNLPLWGEATRSAKYTLNRSPSSAINGRIPSEIFTGKLDLSRIRVFGSQAFAARVSQDDEFNARTHETRFVGYNDNGYRLFDPKLTKFVNPETSTSKKTTSCMMKRRDAALRYQRRRLRARPRRRLTTTRSPMNDDSRRQRPSSIIRIRQIMKIRSVNQRTTSTPQRQFQEEK
ncbi:unnamed protein product [Nesidiocoris tenuis]|uniref:Integrase catalytic domain-containing protein n=1 Tax=Nesidiocoris tenuis TaxID=355587 RepID=A0A6H5GED2_9HEMI|nr:unnamed protein product [Nesidiocoris tenuis]